MASSLEIPELHVEGHDDLHSIAHLLRRHGINMDEGNRPFQIHSTRSVEQLLALIPDAIKAATSRPVGFVLDIDVEMTNRWAAVRSKLLEANVEAPSTCPANGFVGRRQGYPREVGVWLMPDCAMDFGRLEDLLSTLVPAKDPLWAHAGAATQLAKAAGAKFRNTDELKAKTHCWLSWQKNPGLPFGEAIKATYFGHTSPQAQFFLRWLKQLFSLSQLAHI